MRRWRARPFYGWLMISGLGVTELVSWGLLIYAFSVLIVPMRDELGWSMARSTRRTRCQRDNAGAGESRP